jgi:formate dehydrogenase subunit gamma
VWEFSLNRRMEEGVTQAMTDEIARLVAPHVGRRGALLPLLHDIQAALGYVPDEAVPAIARGLNLSRAEVHGVVTFYHDFRRAPPARHVVKLCRAEACQARGAAAIEQEVERRLGVTMGQARPDGEVALEPVYCLGLCATGPNALVDGRPVSRLDVARLEAVAAGWAL